MDLALGVLGVDVEDLATPEAKRGMLRMPQPPQAAQKLCFEGFNSDCAHAVPVKI